MFDWFYLGLLLVVAFVIIFVALKKQHGLALILPLALSFLIVVLYGQWGGWSSWQQYQQKQAKIKQGKALLAQLKTPQQLIEQLKLSLKQTPEHARGWYLLGKLYAGQGSWAAAHDAFQKAIQLKPRHEHYLMNDIYAEWMLNQKQLNAEMRNALRLVLEKNPKQPDALALVAMDAYQQKHYQEAITSWETLLTLVSQDSEAAGALRQAIARAHRKAKQ